jgi:uncharacterized protein (TIGR02996 family)
MTPRHAFLRAVLDAPHDDAPRLVFADWLDDYGDDADQARARLIRLQCARAALVPGRQGALPPEELILLERYGPRWRAEILGDQTEEGITASFWRGFLADVRSPLALWLELGPALVRRAPLRSVVFTDRSPAVRAARAGDPPGSVRYTWAQPIPGRPAALCDLPPAICRHLPGTPYEVADAVWHEYLSLPEALQAASVAGLAWTRTQSG